MRLAADRTDTRERASAQPLAVGVACWPHLISTPWPRGALSASRGPIDLDPARDFYCTLGLVPIVDARPHCARFYCPDGESTFSLDLGDQPRRGTTVYFKCDDLDGTVQRFKAAGLQFASDPEDKSWLWCEAELFDPSGNRVILYRPGENRLNPPWRLKTTA